MRLYVASNLLGKFYVVASSASNAISLVETALNTEQYGYFHERVVTNISYIAEDNTYPKGNGTTITQISRLFIEGENDGRRK